MIDVTTVVGILAVVTSVGSVVYQRRQAKIMEAGLEKKLEVTITRELDAPESETGTEMESKLRTVINRRLSDNRARMRQEFGPKIDRIEQLLRDSHLTDRREVAENALQLLTDQRGAMDVVKESNSKLEAFEHDLQALQRQITDIRSGVGNQGMIRAQIRAIAEQLLQMAGEEYRSGKPGVQSSEIHMTASE